MPPPINPYDLKLLRNQAAIARKILQNFESGIQSLTPVISSINYKGKPFKLSDYPQLAGKVESLTKKLHLQIYSTVANGITESWQLSNKKNDVLVDKRVAGKRLKKNAKQALYDPNAKALQSFMARKEKGLNLSERIWNSLEPFKHQVEQTIGIGIGKGQPAKEMAKELQKGLLEPDRLYRRVRGEDGKLHLSSAARNYHPGQGVYRSSYKNAFRVARTETNMSYRTADYERWQKMPFVIGIRIKLSNAHPKYDICDSMVGLYPKDFKFMGWHPQCICFATPEMMTDEEYDRMEAQILNGEPITVTASNIVNLPPSNFGKYLKDNKEMLSRLKNEPYWIRDNGKYVEMANKIAKFGKLPVDFSKLSLDEFIPPVTTGRRASLFPELTVEEKASIYGYTDNEYYSLNSYLRGLRVTPSRAESLDNYRNLLNNALDAIPEKFNGVVYRGTRLTEEQIYEYRKAKTSKKPVIDNSFTSTSYDPGKRFDGNTFFTILSKNGRLIESISLHNESEVLFKAGTKFRVTKLKREGSKTFIEMEEI